MGTLSVVLLHPLGGYPVLLGNPARFRMNDEKIELPNIKERSLSLLLRETIQALELYLSNIHVLNFIHTTFLMEDHGHSILTCHKHSTTEEKDFVS